MQVSDLRHIPNTPISTKCGKGVFWNIFDYKLIILKHDTLILEMAWYYEIQHEDIKLHCGYRPTLEETMETSIDLLSMYIKEV